MFKKILLLTPLLIASSAWAEDTMSFTTGLDYSTGKYGGTSSTNIMYVPVTGKYQTDNYFLKLTVPYISVSSTGEVVRGMGKIKTTTSTKVVTQSGLGDVIAAAGYTVFEGDQLMLDLVGNIKFGTADETKNIGTGENDYSAQLDGYYELDTSTLFATAGYKVVGAPVGITVNNIAYGSLGFSKTTGDTTSAGLMLDAAQASSSTSSGTRELALFVSNRLSDSLKIQASLLKGFSSSSPDFGASVMITGTM